MSLALNFLHEHGCPKMMMTAAAAAGSSTTQPDYGQLILTFWEDFELLLLF